MQITMSVKTKWDGWQEQCTRPFPHARWDDFDCSWINQMLDDGADIITIGEVMYNVKYSKQ